MQERFKQLRKELRLTQMDFGKKLGVSRSVIANIELGRVKANDIFINHVAEVFSVNVLWLSDGEGDMFAVGEEYDPHFEELWQIYKKLKPNFKTYLLNEITELLKRQNSE